MSRAIRIATRAIAGMIGALVLVVLAAPPLARLSGNGTLADRPLPVGVPVDVGSTTLNVTGESDRPDVVLVHGRPGGAVHMEPLRRALAARGLRVASYDRAGYGESSARIAGAPHTRAQSARELAALLDRITDRPVWLVGYSYGGGVVQELARVAPHAIRGAVLVSSVGPARRATTPGIVARALFSPAVVRWTMRIDPLARRIAAATMVALFAPEPLDVDMRDDLLAAIARPGGVEAWIGEGRAEEDAVSAGPLAMLDVAVLVVHGLDDAIVHFAVAEDLAGRIPRAQLLAIDGA